jgi:hypothetical protein
MTIKFPSDTILAIRRIQKLVDRDTIEGIINYNNIYSTSTNSKWIHTEITKKLDISHCGPMDIDFWTCGLSCHWLIINGFG